jgi:hypothetical protein
LIFLGIGPFALPILWRSRGFSMFWKTVLTILIAVLTALLALIVWYVIVQSRAVFDELKLIEGF